MFNGVSEDDYRFFRKMISFNSSHLGFLNGPTLLA